MSPEERARAFIDTISDGWGEYTEAQDAAALATVSRQAEKESRAAALEEAKHAACRHPGLRPARRKRRVVAGLSL
jgi:hypothetical protein